MTHTPLNRMAKMSDKTKRAINKGRRKAGLKPIKFGAKKKKLFKQQREPTRKEFTGAGYTKKEIDAYFNRKMKLFLHRRKDRENQ